MIDKDKGPFKFTTCSMCGKEFIRQPGSIYKLHFAGKMHHFCCYTCWMKGKKVKESVNEANYKRLCNDCEQH